MGHAPVSGLRGGFGIILPKPCTRNLFLPDAEFHGLNQAGDINPDPRKLDDSQLMGCRVEGLGGFGFRLSGLGFRLTDHVLPDLLGQGASVPSTGSETTKKFLKSCDGGRAGQGLGV